MSPSLIPVVPFSFFPVVVIVSGDLSGFGFFVYVRFPWVLAIFHRVFVLAVIVAGKPVRLPS